MDSVDVKEIVRLRALNLSPKQIARKLGLRPAEVTAVIKAQAEEASLARAERGELPPVKACFINTDAVGRLLGHQPQRQGFWQKQKDRDEDENSGFAQIFVARLERNRYLVCSYLVDYWCLGVKDALGPRKFDRSKYEAFIQKAYARFSAGYQEITLEQAQSIVWGGVDYAASLGLQPHQDFEKAKAHLGERPENLIEIEFGRNGKPFYFSGPYDNTEKIIATLRKTVGEDNFEYMVALGDDDFGW